MSEGRTTASIQRYLDQLGDLRGDAPAEPIVRELLERATQRLHVLCATMLHKSYPRLARPPLNLSADEMLSGVVERMLKALRAQHPENVRRFFALANQHMRWELNEMARGLDQRTPEAELTSDVAVAPPERSGAPQGRNVHRILDAIEQLPEDEREVFSLVRIQGMAHTEASEVLGVATKTIQRRLQRSILLLSEQLGDLVPPDAEAEPA
jgi:RNA polymerase sigma-70 factor (ECF subfamily)